LTYNDARFFPDGKRLLLFAAAPGRPARLWVQDIAAGEPRPLTPEGFEFGPISPDGKWVATRDTKGNAVLYPVDAGEPRPIGGATPDDRVVRFDAEGKSLFLAMGHVPVRIDRVELSTGRRELWKEIGPADSTSVPDVGVFLTPDGKSYAYTFFRGLG